MNSARCTTGNARSPRRASALRQNFSQQTDGSLLVTRNSADRTGSMAPDNTTACQVFYRLRPRAPWSGRVGAGAPPSLPGSTVPGAGARGYRHSRVLPPRVERVLAGEISEKVGWLISSTCTCRRSGVNRIRACEQLDRGADNLLPQRAFFRCRSPASGCSPTFPAVVVRVTSALAISRPFPVHERRTLAAVPQKVIVTITK